MLIKKKEMKVGFNLIIYITCTEVQRNSAWYIGKDSPFFLNFYDNTHMTNIFVHMLFHYTK